MCVVTSGQLAELADSGPVIAQSTTPSDRLWCTSAKDSGIGVPPSYSTNLAKFWS